MARLLRKISAIAVVLLCVSASLRLETAAQIRPVYDQGALGLAQQLKRLNTTASALMIGAHPDDEDTALLAYLARGENARTAYLSLTRGDGGQNILGPELGEALGVIRTEELLQARKLDGAEQFFTRAYDYGFSKTLAEAKSKWDEKVILCDVVRVIREYRPLVVISQFSGTPADGHGQHQFAGYISPLAVKAAADPAQCGDSLPIWRVKKFYLRHRGQGEPTLRMNTGTYDQVLGRSYFEIAMHARSQHRSQEQGVLELKGDQFSAVTLVEGDASDPKLFSGIDTSVASVGALVGNSESRFAEAAKRLQDTISGLSLSTANGRADLVSRLVAGYKLAYDAEWVTRDPASKAVMKHKQRQFLDAIKLAAGIQIDAISDRETVVGGEEFTASARLFFPSSETVKVKDVSLKTPSGWNVETVPTPTDTQPAFRREVPKHVVFFKVRVKSNERPTEPYWLAEPRDGDMFRWNSDDNRTLPIQPPVASAEIKLDVHGVELVFTQPVEYRFADDIRGEIRRNLNVVLPVSLEFDQEIFIVPKKATPMNLTMIAKVTNNSPENRPWRVSLSSPGDTSLKSSPSGEIEMKRRGEKLALPFTMNIPATVKSGIYPVYAQATAGETAYDGRTSIIEYPHIQTHRIYTRAETKVSVIDLEVAPVKVGYVMGSGDRVAQAIRQIGASVEEIDAQMLASGDLSKFNTIVVGIRAYQVRPDVVANNQRLLDFAKNGGTLIVQYQLPPTYTQQNLTPYPAQTGPRVADENAAVTILQPEHAVFTYPNKITQEDFKGWVQERNLYNFSTMDPKYTGLLESHDAGEAENKGGLVIADVGKGKYVYCSYSLFRQLPAGVPGAYRLLANMVSLGKSAK